MFESNVQFNIVRTALCRRTITASTCLKSPSIEEENVRPTHTSESCMFTYSNDTSAYIRTQEPLPRSRRRRFGFGSHLQPFQFLFRMSCTCKKSGKDQHSERKSKQIIILVRILRFYQFSYMFYRVQINYILINNVHILV